ncbi:MAG: copper chaperone PCu(A)C [Actinobacteria bacterium]|nr:copper chaperone PCu(A)C [Actinomycetota bacterium]
MHRVRVTAVAVLVALAAAACGSADPGVTVEGAWARPSPAMADAGAVYLDLTAASDDELIAAEVDPSIAGVVEIHETAMSDDGTMAMQEVGSIDLPGGTTVSLEPGGYHIMLLHLPRPLENGETFSLTLGFAESDSVQVTVEVREDAP